MALFSSAADTFVFSFLTPRFLFREGRSTTEMLPAQEAWRICGEGLFTGVRGRGILRSSSKQSSSRSLVNKGVGILSPRPQLYVFPLIRSELRPRPPPCGARILLRLPFGDPCRHALSCLVSLRSPARSVWFLRLVLLLPWLGGGASDPSAD